MNSFFYANCCAAQSSFLCFDRESSEIAGSVALPQRFLQWPFLWGFLWWVAVYRKQVWISLSHLISLTKHSSFIFQLLLLPSMPPTCMSFGVGHWNGLASPLLPTLILTVPCHLPFPQLLSSPHLSFPDPPKGALLWVTWPPSKSSSVENLLCYFTSSNL